MWVLLKVLLQVVLRLFQQIGRRVLPRVLVVVGIAVAVVVVLSSPVLLWLLVLLVKGPPEAEQCATSTVATRAPDHAAADRLRHTLGGLPGVVATEVGFDEAGWLGRGAERVRLTVGLAADVGPEQVLAAVAPALDGLRGPEFAGLDAYVAFLIDPAASASELQVFGLPPTEDVLADAAVWLDVHSRHPGTKVQMCRDPDGGFDRTLEVPIVWDEDPDAVPAAFAELASLPVDMFHWSWVSVHAVPDAAGRSARSTFTVVEVIPEDEVLRGMVSAVRRPPSMAPTDDLATAVTSYPPMGDSAPRTEVTVEFGLAELRHAPASEVLAPDSRAQRVAAEFAAQVEASVGYRQQLDVSHGDTQILDE